MFDTLHSAPLVRGPEHSEGKRGGKSGVYEMLQDPAAIISQLHKSFARSPEANEGGSSSVCTLAVIFSTREYRSRL